MISVFYSGDNTITTLQFTNEDEMYNVATYIKIFYPGSSITLWEHKLEINYLDKTIEIEENEYYVGLNIGIERQNINLSKTTQEYLFKNFSYKGIEDSFNYNDDFFKHKKQELYGV